MYSPRLFQPHVAVYTCTRIPAGRKRLVTGHHCDKILARFQIRSDIYTERIISVCPFTRKATIYVHLGVRHHSIKIQVVSVFLFVKIRSYIKMLAVAAPTIPRQLTCFIGLIFEEWAGNSPVMGKLHFGKLCIIITGCSRCRCVKFTMFQGNLFARGIKKLDFTYTGPGAVTGSSSHSKLQ